MSELPSARALPRGFRFASASCGLKKRGHTGSLDVALIVSDPPASAAAVFTQNLVQAPPVVLSREHVRASAGAMRAVIVNSGNANCSVGPGGMVASRATAERVAELLGCGAQQVVVCSTGVIGVPLPVERILKAAPGLAKSLAFSAARFRRPDARDHDHGHAPEARRRKLPHRRKNRARRRMRQGRRNDSSRTWRRCFPLSSPTPRSSRACSIVALREVVGRTFNCITVDGDSSTNDTLLVLANGASGAKKITEANGADYAKFVAALEQVCKTLAIGIVEDGEGATHVVEIEVRGAPSDAAAKQVAADHRPLVAREDGHRRRRSQLGTHPRRRRPLGRSIQSRPRGNLAGRNENVRPAERRVLLDRAAARRARRASPPARKKYSDRRRFAQRPRRRAHVDLRFHRRNTSTSTPATARRLK